MTTETIPAHERQGAASARSVSGALPVRREFSLLYGVSWFIALLVAAVALAGLLFPNIVYPTEETLHSFLPVDVFHLLVGVPCLLASLRLARQGRLVGLLCWPGVLLYVLYSYTTNLLGVPFGALFLPYLFLVTLSAYTTIAVVASIDGDRVRHRLGGKVPARAAAAVLIGFSALFVVMNVSAIAGALGSRPPAEPEHPVFVLIADFTTAIPLCLAGGTLLWRSSALGYTAGVGLLLFYSLLLMGLVPALLFPAFYDGSPVAVADTVLMLSFALICLALFSRFVRAARSEEI